jgi:hypothetical protein
MIAVLVGLVFVVAGAWGIARWFSDFVLVVRGLGPVSVLLGGLVAVVTGFSSLQPRRRSNAEKK